MNQKAAVHNPTYHDPTNGRFTFAPGGTGDATAGMTRRPKRPSLQPGREDPRTLADEKRLLERAWAADPRNPANYSLYTVRAGDTLTHIAATRVGVTPADLMWLNGLSSDRLRIGQEIKLPHQASLDAGKRGFDTFALLENYMRTHGGRLPPDVAHPPSFAEQLYGAGSRHLDRNGYGFDLDPQGRTRVVTGVIHFNLAQGRSRPNQATAGGADRLPSDEGGHYIARRFDGPTDAFNHFAQDGVFNRSDYRRLENQWARATVRGEKVRVVIRPDYNGGSGRPSRIVVSWMVAGRVQRAEFSDGKEN